MGLGGERRGVVFATHPRVCQRRRSAGSQSTGPLCWLGPQQRFPSPLACRPRDYRCGPAPARWLSGALRCALCAVSVCAALHLFQGFHLLVPAIRGLPDGFDQKPRHDHVPPSYVSWAPCQCSRVGRRAWSIQSRTGQWARCGWCSRSRLEIPRSRPTVRGTRPRDQPCWAGKNAMSGGAAPFAVLRVGASRDRSPCQEAFCVPSDALACIRMRRLVRLGNQRPFRVARTADPGVNQDR